MLPRRVNLLLVLFARGINDAGCPLVICSLGLKKMQRLISRRPFHTMAGVIHDHLEDMIAFVFE